MTFFNPSSPPSFQTSILALPPIAHVEFLSMPMIWKTSQTHLGSTPHRDENRLLLGDVRKKIEMKKIFKMLWKSINQLGFHAKDA